MKVGVVKVGSVLMVVNDVRVDVDEGVRVTVVNGVVVVVEVVVEVVVVVVVVAVKY